MTPHKIKKIFSAFKKAKVKPTTELQYGNTFQLLVAVALSAQSTDKGVNKATESLFKFAKKPEDILKLKEEGLKEYIKTIGLYNTKAKNILKTCALLVEKHNSKVPSTRTELEALPGVGRKTANVILNTAFGEPTMAVDTHIFRLSNRTGIAPGKTVLAVEKNLLKNIPDEYMQDAHHWLILHGRYTCIARKPKCGECIIRQWCDYSDKVEWRMFPLDRNKLRQMYFDAWQKHQAKMPLNALEQQIVAVILEHPEHHKTIEKQEASLSKNYFAETGEVNPFLHMGLHLGLREQLSTNRPAGIAPIYKTLRENMSSHDAEHHMMQCLADTIFLAQRDNAIPDEKDYIEALKKLIEK